MRKTTPLVALALGLSASAFVLSGCDIGSSNDAINDQEKAKLGKVTTANEMPPGLSNDIAVAPTTQPQPNP